MEKHLIIVSVDAMVYEDLAQLSHCKHIGHLMRNGSLIEQVTTIYPSLTHPVHASLITGCTPGKTGIFDNEVFNPCSANMPWNNRLDQIRCDTLLHAAHRAGLTTCACRWPMTAGGFDVIDYLIPEVLDEDTAREPDLEALYRQICSPDLFEEIVRPHLHTLDPAQRHPAYEQFSMDCACDIIRKYRPNLLLCHPGQVDHARHTSGLFSPMVSEALEMTDTWVGQLMQAVEDAGIADSTSFAIVSDHGHLEYSREIALNVYFAQKGLLTLDKRGRLADWSVYVKGTGLSAQVYMKENKQTAQLGQTLQRLAHTGLYGFSEVLTAAQARERYGLYGHFAFVLEGDGYTAFSSDLQGALVRTHDPRIYGVHHSTHGHMPEKGPQPPMIVCGPAFTRGVTLPHASILDEAPTFAAALGVALPDAQGNAIGKLLLT